MNPSLIHTSLSKNREKKIDQSLWLEDKQQNFVFSDNRKNALIYQEWVRSPESGDLNLPNKRRKSDNMFSVVKKTCSFVDLRLKRERSLLKTKNII